MSLAPYLELKSEVMPINRRDFALEDLTLLNPNGANPLLDGEWLELSTNYKLQRGTGEQGKPAWQCWAERGRYDTQAIGKTVVLFIGGYEAETSVCNLTGMTVGDGLVAQDVTIGGLTKRGLAKLGAGAGQHRTFGYVTRLPGGGRVRFFVPAAGGGWVTV